MTLRIVNNIEENVKKKTWCIKNHTPCRANMLVLDMNQKNTKFILKI